MLSNFIDVPIGAEFRDPQSDQWFVKADQYSAVLLGSEDTDRHGFANHEIVEV